MQRKHRLPEGQTLDHACEDLFARVARLGGRPAAGRITKILKNSVKPGMKVLDIGTGPGTIPVHLKKRHPDVFFAGLDISPNILQKAMRDRTTGAASVAFLCADGETLPFAEGSFDVVLSFFALHHMDHPDRVLHEIDRVLKPGGALLLIDFKRDMAAGLFRLLNSLWNTAFFMTAGRSGFERSVRSSWLAGEIEEILRRIGITRFHLHVNSMELWVMARIGGTGA